MASPAFQESLISLPADEVEIPDSVYGVPDLSIIEESVETGEENSKVAENDLDEEAAVADSTRAYLNEIGKTALINASTEVELSKRIEAGLFAGKILIVRQKKSRPEEYAQIRGIDVSRLQELANRRSLLTSELKAIIKDGEEAKDHLLRANLRLVVSLAKRYTGHGMALMDLVQEGNIGLIRAVEKFDYTKGFKFSTYATWWIRQAIGRSMADQARTIRIPVHMVEVINKMNRIRRELNQELGRPPSYEELGKELNITPEDVMELEGYSRDIVSLDQEVGNDGDASLGDLIEDKASRGAIERSAEESDMSNRLDKALEVLETREAAILKMRYGIGNQQPMTLDEIGQHFKLSRERIRQIVDKSMAKLRHPSRAQSLMGLLD